MIRRKLTLEQIQKTLVCQVLSNVNPTFIGISTDTREDMSGCLFWALVGEAHDAHSFLFQAQKKSAAGILVHKITPEVRILAEKMTVIVVPDTLLALQELAKAIRLSYQVPVIGITGSNGKTSTKEFTASILESSLRLHWSKGSFNNHWGVPFSILSAPDSIDAILLEMGMNHHGELKSLCSFSLPDIVICTLVGKTHMEHFGSVDEIAKAKEEIYQNAKEDAIRIYNLDNPWTRKMYERRESDYPKARKFFTYSGNLSERPDVCFQKVSQGVQGVSLKGQIAGVAGSADLPVIGEHHIANAMAAAAIGLAVGISPQKIWMDLHKCHAAWGRMQLLKNSMGVSILFDGYNASPDSYRALMESMEVFSKDVNVKNKVGVFAEMRELGPSAPMEHFEVGQLAARQNFNKIWFYGPSKDFFVDALKKNNYSGEIIASVDFDLDVANQIVDEAQAGDLFVVKGSRGLATERFVKLLKPWDWGTY